MSVKIIIEVERCFECPFCSSKHTMNAGDAYDYWCNKTKYPTKIASYVEYMSEFPKEIPSWCPFRKAEQNGSSNS